jgi:Ca-activated chloride channel homolog
MNAVDLPPSRLVRARFEVLDLLDAGREGQVALIAYGAEPFVVSPLTGDAETIAAQVPDLTTDLLPVRGPARADLALELAGSCWRGPGAGGGIVILVTGGLTETTAGRPWPPPRPCAARGTGSRCWAWARRSGAPIPVGTGAS